MKMNWSTAVSNFSQQGKAYVLITIVGVSGSTPRNSGTKMVVTEQAIFDSIGGGHLEHKAIKHALLLLTDGQQCQQLERFKLGSQLGQCCGGTAHLLFECFATNPVNIMLFGAGHVGQALVTILQDLPCQLTWVDSRENQFPTQVKSAGDIDFSHIKTIVSEHPEDEVKRMPTDSYFVVMTHNHPMDFSICQTILKRADFGYLGLIASETKWRRFQLRFQHRELDPLQVERMHCPIGLSKVKGKRPMEVAVSVAAQIIQHYQEKRRSATPEINQGVHWKQLNDLLAQQKLTETEPTEANLSGVSQ